MDTLLSLISHLSMKLIQIYQLIISPIFGKNCRFQPTCSQYAYISIYNFGVLKGSWLIIKRILKCHSFN